MNGYPSFLEFVRARYGTRWIVAQRLTPRMRAEGWEHAISRRRYSALREEWRDAHPLVEYARQLPPGPMQAELFLAACEHVDRFA